MLWVLLPLAILFAGVAPAAISFAAGQAAFTLTLVILFNIIAPAGWRVGLVRVEDIAIGCAVSLVVGLLFWPRGAAAALRQALAEAYTDTRALPRRPPCSSGWSAATRGADGVPPPAPPTPRPSERPRPRAGSTTRSASYLAERGAKPVAARRGRPALVTGVVGLRLAADAVLDLWQRDDGPGRAATAAAARAELLAVQRTVGRTGTNGWPGASSRTARRRGPADARPDGRRPAARGRAPRPPRRGRPASGTAVRIIWTGDHLDAARRLQATLRPPRVEA